MLTIHMHFGKKQNVLSLELYPLGSAETPPEAAAATAVSHSG